VVEVNGQWFTHYIAGPIFTDYTDPDGVVHTASEQYEAYCFGKDAEQGKSVRDDRNKRLADCDWTQLADSPLDADANLRGLCTAKPSAWCHSRQASRGMWFGLSNQQQNSF
jgi:hypothetical protein